MTSQRLLLVISNNVISTQFCSQWGFPCAVCYHPAGVLLPHLFTLALIRRFIFCGTIPRVAPASR